METQKIAINLIDTLNKIFGNDWTDMSEPESLSIILEKKGIELSIPEMESLNAIKTLMSIISPWEDPYIFENIVDALNGRAVIPETLTKPPIECVISAVNIMKDINDRNIFSEDIEMYIAAIAQYEQLILLPPPLDFCNKHLPKGSREVQEARTELHRLMPSILALNVDSSSDEPQLLDIQINKLIAILQNVD